MVFKALRIAWRPWGQYGAQLGFRADFSTLADRDRDKSSDFGLI
jgi:hypothetical protein